jgi:putative MFS transporter
VGSLVNFGVVTGYYGMVLWAPTLLAQIQGISGAQAAQIMIGFSVTGLLSRLVMGWLADRFGRRRCGGFAALGAALLLVIAGLVGRGTLLTPDLFWLPFALAFVFADSGFSIMGMYTSEIWPSRLRGRGSGVSYAAGSVGKILGPLGLALLIGSSNLIKPEATVGALLPAFSYLAGMLALAGFTYLLVARETRGETLEQIESSLR